MKRRQDVTRPEFDSKQLKHLEETVSQQNRAYFEAKARGFVRNAKACTTDSSDALLDMQVARVLVEGLGGIDFGEFVKSCSEDVLGSSLQTPQELTTDAKVTEKSMAVPTLVEKEKSEKMDQKEDENPPKEGSILLKP